MKNLYIKLFFVCVSIFCSPLGAGGQAISTDKNAIVHSKFRVATTNEADASDPTKAIINIQYMDGLGRPLQTVGYQQSPTQKDIISGATGYDRYGRNSLSVLPVAASSGTGNYQSSTVTLGQGFYSDTRPYSSVLLYERSTEGREREIMGPGQTWQTNDKKSQVFDEIAGSDIRLYKLDGSNNIIKVGSYPANSLYKKRIIDEQGHTSIEIKDKQGRLVQKQTQDETGYITTYYIYDGLNRVRTILQPRGYELDQTINYNSAEWNNWVFFYVYDNRSRVIEKKIPGADAEWMVYDKWDRLVWQQSALQREQGKWTFMKYDSFNRLVMSGEKSESRNRAALQAEANNWTGDRYESRVTGGDIYYSYSNTYPQIFNPAEIRLVSYFDDYDNWRPNDMLFDGANAYHPQQSSTTGFATGGRSRNSENGTWLVSVNYYDNKKRLIQTFNHNLYGQVERTDYKYNFAGEAIEIRYLMRDVSNVATIQLERFDYDNVGRKTAYKLGMNAVGETIATYEYDEIGRLKTKKIYPDQTFTTGGALDYINRPPSPNANIDDVARKAINLNEGTVIDAATITKYSAVIDPNAAGGTNIQGLQTMDYTYHIRGGVRGINLDGAGNPTPDATQGDLFSYKLDYETAGFYDGNIGKQTWQSVENNSPLGIRSYTYNYDPVSRLKSATYAGINGEDYSLPNLSYDKNGNITNLQRKGKNGSSFGDIDNLAYAYNGNRLATVTDGILGDHTIDLVPRGSGNYTYYTDGSLKSDENEQIANITYDTYLKQPTEITLTDGRWIKYYYSGSGGLLKTLYSTNESWEYGGKLIYKNGIRYQISQQEGRLTYENNDWKLEFQYTDHLGNTRISFRANGSQLEKVSDTSFDPWGVVLNGINLANGFQNRFEFQGKEKESTFNLNRINLGARTINPTIGRFDRVDPLAEKMLSWSTYTFCFDNPIKYFDTDGRIPYPITIRAFAPFKEFGFGFHGDSRGYSTSSNVTARMHQRINFDTDKSSVSTKAWSSPTYRASDPSGAKTATPSVEFTKGLSISENGDSKTFEFATSAAAANPKTPSGTPDINVFSDFSVTENKKAGTLSIRGILTGDNFPSTEAFVSDPSGNNLFLGVGQIGANVGRNTGPFTELPGENSRNPVTSFSITIITDKKGNFTSVKSGGKTYSISDWNKKYLDTKPQKQE